MPTLCVGAEGLMAVAGARRGKALKVKGNAESGERRGGESLDAGDETKAGWTAVAAAVAGGPLRGPCSECGVALRLRLPGAWASATVEDGEEVGGLDEEDDRGVWGLLLALRGKGANGWCCWCCRSRGWLRWVAGEPKAEPQARWLRPE